MSEITEIVYLNNTDNFPLIDLKMKTLWAILWEERTGLMVGLY